jgi:ADYC domain
MLLLRPALVSLALLAVACAAENEPASLPVDLGFRCPGCNWGPPLLNSHGLNGLPLSALDTTGVMHDGWRLVEVEVPGDHSAANRPVHDVHVEDGVLYGTDEWGTQVSGGEFVGSIWQVELQATGTKELMEIVEHVADPTAARYTFIASASSSGVSDPKLYTCPEDPDSGGYSLVLFRDLDVDPESGTHLERKDTIYFGCTAAAVGKAAVWGYSPWATDEDHHQTASRTARADYCGDGTPYTITGTQLQLEDGLGIQAFSDPSQLTEAFWGPAGALCIKEPRLYDVMDIHCAGNPVPFCSVEDTPQDWPGALLWSKVWN